MFHVLFNATTANHEIDSRLLLSKEEGRERENIDGQTVNADVSKKNERDKKEEEGESKFSSCTHKKRLSRLKIILLLAFPCIATTNLSSSVSHPTDHSSISEPQNHQVDAFELPKIRRSSFFRSYKSREMSSQMVTPLVLFASLLELKNWWLTLLFFHSVVCLSNSLHVRLFGDGYVQIKDAPSRGAQ